MNQQLPFRLIEVMKTGELKRTVGSWQLKRSVDCYENELETELSEVCCCVDDIQYATKQLSQDFVPDDDYGSDDVADYPGAIRDITEFGDIVCFAFSADGAPFCLDYRNNRKEPTVIWWDDICWRLVAPNYSTFFELFDFRS